ncbi:MAG: hypothetical protein KDA57_04175 [Planctomycetales bacterium]|nr:hypothetical protein [Planctomycetales bacterium]
MASHPKRRPASELPAPRRAKRRLLLFLLLIVALVGAAPTIVANTPLRNLLLARAVSAPGWQIKTEHAAFAWTGEQMLAGVSILDSAGQTLVTAEAISLERSLFALATNQSSLGKLRIVRPALNMVTRADGSNLEDFLAALDADTTAKEDQNASSAKNAPNISVEIVSGIVQGYDQPSQQQWRIDEANLLVGLGSATAGGIALSGNMNLSSAQGGAPGRVQVRFQQIAEHQSQLDLLAETLPLAPLEPFLSRTLPGCRVAGTVSSNAHIRWTRSLQGELVVQTSGRLDAHQFDLTADALQGDRLTCQTVSAPWEVSFAGDEITVGQLAVDAGWARLQVNGSVTLAELESLSMTSLPKRGLNLAGELQLDRLAVMVPRTLQLREGVQVDSGTMEFHAESKPSDQGLRWSASAKVRDVVGTDGRRAIRWEQPIEAQVELADSDQGPQVKQFLLNSPFAGADLKTAANEVSGDFQLDLGRLSQELGQFVDLDAWQFAGSGAGKLALTRGTGNHFEASAEIHLTDLKVAHESRQIWAEPQLLVHLDASGQEADLQPQRLAAGTIKLRGPRDNLDLELLQEVDLTAVEKDWRLQVQGNGPLDSWADRLRPWTNSVPAEVAGQAQLKAKLNLAAGKVHLLESEGSITGLRVRDAAIAIDEPQLQFAGDCRWDSAANSLSSRELQLVSSSLAFRSRNLSVELGPSSVPTTKGDVAFRANLERLASAVGMVGPPDSIWPRGTTAGNLQLSSNAQRLEANFSATADQLQVVRNAGPDVAPQRRPEVIWAEPQLEASGKANYTIAADRLQLQDLQVTGQTVRFNTTATLDKLTDEGTLQAGGTLEYQEAALDQLLASYLGPEVRVRGDRHVRFQISGQLADSQSSEAPTHWSRRWNFTTDAGWSSASAYGLPLSAARVQSTLRDGQLQFAPFDIAVGQGRLTASPLVIFDPLPQRLILPSGPLVTRVQISQQVSENMLKYVAPIVAGATRSEGEFSVALDRTQIPFADPKQAQVAGQLEVHQLRVAPGPLVAELIALLEQIDALTKGKQLFQAASTPRSSNALTIDNRRIDFQIDRGRVYHRNLEFMVDDVPVRSYGSVGFDQTLALEIEIPIQDKWIDRQSALQSLAGQTIKLPIQGTLAKPQIDQRAVAELSRQMLQGVATEAIGGEINRALEKLFKSR